MSKILLVDDDSEDDKIIGLLLGADDYMIKPYSLRELEARIQVQIRKNHQFNQVVSANILSFPPLSIDLVNHKVFYNDEEILLSNKEFDLLKLLAKHPNKTFEFEEIGNRLWGGYIDTDRKTIMVTASRLRKKLDAYPTLQNIIETVWSKGYKFVLKV